MNSRAVVAPADTGSINTDELNRLLQFASGSATERGYVPLDEVGNPEPRAKPSLLITARMAHSFALGYMVTGYNSYRRLATLGVKTLNSLFRDPVNDGFIDDTADNSTRYPQQLYLTSFVLLAGSTGCEASIPTARELYRAALHSLDHFWDEHLGVFRNALTVDSQHSDDYIGANGNMHAVEALLAAGSYSGDPALGLRACRIAEFFIHQQAWTSSWMLPEHYSSTGTPLPDYNVDNPRDEFRPYGITPGHLFEWSRLLLELESLLDDPPTWITNASQHLYQTAKTNGWTDFPSPGFIYTTDTTGTPVVTLRPHWVLAEAISAAATQADDSAAIDLRQWQQHALDHYVDLHNGSWHHELDDHNQPSHEMWSGKPDVYHALQASLIPHLPVAPSIAARIRLKRNKEHS